MNRTTVRNWVIASLTGAAAFVLPSASVYGQKTPSNVSVAAIVNGEPIPMSELDAVLQAVPASTAPPSPAEQRQLRAEALELIIDDVLIRQFLSSNAPKTTPGEYEKELNTLLTGLKAKNMSLPDYLRESKQTEEHLRLEIVKKLQWERYVKENVKGDVLKRCYEENRDFYDRVTVQASHIVFRLSPSAKDGERNALKARLAELRERIVGGKIDFAEAARKYSQCQSASRNGDLGFFPRKWAVDESIAKAAFASPVGAVSEVVQTDHGLHLVKVTARKPGKPSTFDAVKDEVRKNYTMELWHDLISKQRKAAKIENKLT